MLEQNVFFTIVITFLKEAALSYLVQSIEVRLVY